MPHFRVPGVLTNKYHLAGLAVVLIWMLPILLSRGRIEWGDFSYFSQIHEAIKLSILNYHQFPWWNPWIAGGIPLYANPQAGVFSIQTFLSFFMAVPVALKLTIVLFYLGGYVSFLYLMSYFRVRGLIAALLGLIWILNGFFVAHLPAHFTFIWFLLAPGFVYLALQLRSRKSGVILGVALGMMALAQVHYSFVGIGLVVGVIILTRLLLDKGRKQIFVAALIAGMVFAVLALNRVILTLEAVKGFPRLVNDPVSGLSQSAFSFLLPYSYNLGHYFPAPHPPFYGWGEQTVYPGLFFAGAVLVSAALIVYLFKTREATGKGGDKLRIQQAVAVVGALFFTLLVGLGDKAPWMPYHLLKTLPLFKDTRISARWFIFTLLGLLVFVAIVYMHRMTKGFPRFLVTALLGFAVVELFILNFGYQYKVLSQPVSKPPRKTTSLTFQQQIRFGESLTSPDGLVIPGAHKQFLYREYESTLFNIGTLLANEVYVDLYNNDTPKCSYANACGLVLTKNADVDFWSPNKIILKRTAPGPIELNMNNSNYAVINGARQSNAGMADRKSRFFLPVSDTEERITLVFAPNASVDRLKRALQ